MSAREYQLPATAICPGCGTMVTLPPEPIYPDSPPAVCATCDTEVPDYRRESYTPPPAYPAAPSFSAPPAISPTPSALSPEPLTERKISRGGLFRSLGGLIAERAEGAVETAKATFDETAKPHLDK
jgi:hypothetical protein